MAVKGMRRWNPVADSDAYFTDAVAEAGIVVVRPTGTVTPPGYDDADNIARVPSSNDDGAPIGLLLDSVVNKDLTDCDLRTGKREVAIGGKAEVATGGVFITDMIDTGATVTPGATAYYTTGGKLHTTGVHVVGEFETNQDSAGFARIRLGVK